MLWPLLLAALWQTAQAHHILCIFPTPSQSHDLLGKGVVNALLDAGHQVTWATPFPKKTEKKNLNIIDLSVTRKLADALDMTDPRNRDAGLALVQEFGLNISSVTLQSEALRTALVKQQFDAVVTEWFFNDVDAGYAAIQQVPWILLSGIPVHLRIESLMDEVRSLPTHPLMINDFPVPMSLGQRLVNSAIGTVMGLNILWRTPSNAAFYEANFAPLARARGVPLPPFLSALHNVSIVLANQHPSVMTPQSLPPNVVDIAGYHIEQNPPPLPKDLQDLLDGSPEGVVYFSLGSVIKSSSLAEHTQKALLKVFGGLKQTVLWKFERKLMGVPKNVHVRAWMPQASILAHPNVKVFITHGGLLSTLEAAHYGVPLLAIPVFGDQPSNAARVVRAGVARKVVFGPDMADGIQLELEELLNNESYHKKAKQVSKLFRNRPIAPSRLISYYIELAIESKGAFHLRSPSKLYAWYELWMLDQLAVLLAVLYLLRLALKKTFSYFRKPGSKKKLI